MLRPYLVEIEAEGFDMDGVAGFIAHRFVLASSDIAAALAAIALTQKVWAQHFTKPLSETFIKVVRIERIGWQHFFRNRQQNNGHTFYEED